MDCAWSNSTERVGTAGAGHTARQLDQAQPTWLLCEHVRILCSTANARHMSVRRQAEQNEEDAVGHVAGSCHIRAADTVCKVHFSEASLNPLDHTLST